MLQTDIKKLLALVVLAGFLGIILILFFVSIPPGNLDLLKTFGIALISIVSAVAGYYFGSSESSARKTELMATPPLIGDPILLSGKSTESGFISLRLLPLLALAALVLMLAAGCATTSTPTLTVPGAASGATAKDSPLALAGKSLLAVKSTIVTAATGVDALCKSGALPADKCSQAKAAYETAKPAYDAAVDAYLLMSSKGGDPAAFGAALARVQGIAANLLTIAGGAK